MPTPTTQSYQDLLLNTLCRHEGYRSAIYLDGDGKGYPTIGIGVLIRGATSLHSRSLLMK